MSGRARSALTVVAILTGVVGASGLLAERDLTYRLPDPPERMLYLTSGRVAHVLALSFDALAADIYWIRVVQHYGGDRLSRRTVGRYELLEPLLDLTTTLDPHFSIAYRFGAIFLAEPPPGGPGRVDEAVALLAKGLKADPTRWQYASDTGFLYLWYQGDEREAASWFERAAAIPGAPSWMRPLAAATLAGADRNAARVLLRDLAASSSEPWIRRGAERSLIQLDAMDQLDELQARIDAYAHAHRDVPQSWAAWVSAGVVPGTPVDPVGVPYDYDPASRTVTLSPQSALFPLPATLWKK